MDRQASALRVLIVDQSKIFTRSATRFLADFANLAGIDSIQSLQDMGAPARGTPDLIFVEWQLAASFGWSSGMRAQRSPVQPRIFLIAQDDYPEYHSTAQLWGADGFVPKAEFAIRMLSLLATQRRETTI
jgi:response regulator RpfG family c-di-GMP phosphodiesterase